MIKINLLAVDRERAKRKAKFQIGQKITVGCSLILVAAALVVGWWFWSLQRDVGRSRSSRSPTPQRETQRLQSVIQQVQQFEARRAQLQQRVTLIEQLRKGQTGPVHLLDQISRALPDSMWLTDLRQTGTDVTHRWTVHVAERAVGFRQRARSLELVRRGRSRSSTAASNRRRRRRRN